MHRTLFSDPAFVSAVTASGVHGYRPLTVDVGGRQTLAAIEARRRLGLRHVLLGPFGLYACPPADDADLGEAVPEIVEQLVRLPTVSLRWNVRFDHGALASALKTLGLQFTESKTHVLDIDGDHESQFKHYNTNRRREVRRAAKVGVTVRRAQDLESLRAYYTIHRDLSEQKGRGFDYPFALFSALLPLSQTLFIVAEREREIVAGGFFFVDGDSLLYWHGAANRSHAGSFPTCAVIDEAIRVAGERGLTTVNLGASLGNPGLEGFKASWGASQRTCWKFTWTPRLWAEIQRTRTLSRTLTRMLRGAFSRRLRRAG